MRPQHEAYTLEGFPVYSSAFLSTSKLVLGGGGGQARSGVKNKLRLYDVGPKELKLVDEYELEAGADAPMSLDVSTANESIVCGANSPEEAMKKGDNMHCRLFATMNDKIMPIKSVKAMKSMTGDAYQKVTVVSPTNDLVAIGTTNNEIHLLHYPSLNRAAPVIEISAGELFDVDFSITSVAIASSTNIYIYRLHEDKQPSENMLKAKQPGKSKAGKKGGTKEAQLESLELAHTFVKPKLPSVGSASTSFRAVKFHPKDFETVYAVLNTVATTGRRQRKAYIVKYEWVTKLRAWRVFNTRRINEGSITCFEISADGRFLAYSASDCSIGIVDTVRLSVLAKVLGAHEFPSTTLRFNPDGTLLVSASADSTVRVITVPENMGEQNYTISLSIIVALLVIILALALQLYIRNGGTIPYLNA